MTMEPIVLNPTTGEKLVEYPNTNTKEDNVLGRNAIGLHDVCTGWIDYMEVSDTHAVIKCRHCGLRIYIECCITTFGELRGYLAARYK